MSGLAALALEAATPAVSGGTGGGLTPPQKAAIIISALPPDDAGSLLQKLGQPHIRAYVTATKQLRHVPAETLEQVITEFLESLGSSDITIGPDTLETILSRIMSPEAVSDLIGKPRAVWKRVQDLPADTIALYIEREHPRVSSIVMSRLPVEKAASVLDVLDGEAAERVVDLLKDPVEVKPHVLASVEESIRLDLLLPASKQGEMPEVFVGAVFDNLTENARNPLMKSLHEKSPEFAEAVARRMFLFDDIPKRVGEKDVPALTTVNDQAVLAQALSYATARGSETPEYILSFLPKRMAEQIREAIEEMGVVPQSEGEEAEGTVIKSIRQLSNDGTIALR